MVVKKRIPTSLKVDPELWEEVKIMSIRTKKNITEYFEDALREKLVKDYEVVAVERKIKEQERLHKEQVNRQYQMIVGQDPVMATGESPKQPEQEQSQPQPTDEQKLLQWEQQRQQNPQPQEQKQQPPAQQSQLQQITQQAQRPSDIFSDDNVIPIKEGEYVSMLKIPGLKFPINRTELIEHIKKLNETKGRDILTLELVFAENLPQIKDKMYKDKLELEGQFQKYIRDNKEAFSIRGDNGSPIGVTVGCVINARVKGKGKGKDKDKDKDKDTKKLQSSPVNVKP